MGTSHKHAEVLKAITYGKEVEWFCDCAKEFTIMGKSDQINPISRPDLEWRIKPEPKPDVVYFCNAKFGANDYLDDGDFEPTKTQYPCDNLKLTFDGETKKLKLAEVINDD